MVGLDSSDDEPLVRSVQSMRDCRAHAASQDKAGSSGKASAGPASATWPVLPSADSDEAAPLTQPAKKRRRSTAALAPAETPESAATQRNRRPQRSQKQQATDEALRAIERRRRSGAATDSASDAAEPDSEHEAEQQDDEPLDPEQLQELALEHLVFLGSNVLVRPFRHAHLPDFLHVSIAMQTAASRALHVALCTSVLMCT